jgi:hypothetical protein
MRELVPVTEELLRQARRDRHLRRRLVAEHLEWLTVAMSRAKMRARNGGGGDTARQLEEGARLAVRLTEILHTIG